MAVLRLSAQPGIIAAQGERSTEIEAEVEHLNERAVDAVVEVLAGAFHDYPVMRYVLGGQSDSYGYRLRTLVHLFVMARVLRSEPMLGIEDDGRLVAAAIVSFPVPKVESPAEFVELSESVWSQLGEPAHARYLAYGEAAGQVSVSMPHVHLNMIGVLPGWQGRGLASSLLARVQEVSRQRPGSTGVTLTTESAQNVALYEHVGYEVVGHVRIAPELETWGMFRRDRTEP